MRHVRTAEFDLDHNREYMLESLDEWEGFWAVLRFRQGMMGLANTQYVIPCHTLPEIFFHTRSSSLCGVIDLWTSRGKQDKFP